MAANRQQLAKIIGAADPRVKADALEYVATDFPHGLGRAKCEQFEAFAVRWPVVRGVTSEGFLLVPPGASAMADVIAVPDADQTPETVGRPDAGHLAPESQFARRLAESGCRVLIPTLIDRARHCHRGGWLRGRTNQPHREFIYRQAFEMGRHIIGYEVQKILAAVDWFAHDRAARHAAASASPATAKAG